MDKKWQDQQWRGQRPKRPYKNMADAAFQVRYRQPGTEWTCWECRGGKRIIDPAEEPDPIEGHKFSRHIDCPTCKGEGHVPKPQFRKWYSAEIAKWRKELVEWQAQDRIVKRLVRPLTPEEYGALYCYFHAKPPSWI